MQKVIGCNELNLNWQPLFTKTTLSARFFGPQKAFKLAEKAQRKQAKKMLKQLLKAGGIPKPLRKAAVSALEK
jgi:hypothetical protein